MFLRDEIDIGSFVAISSGCAGCTARGEELQKEDTGEKAQDRRAPLQCPVSSYSLRDGSHHHVQHLMRRVSCGTRDREFANCVSFLRRFALFSIFK